jgi:hypothetical protein
VRYVTRDQGEDCGTKKRCGDNGADLKAAESEVQEIGGQNYECDSINK